LALQSPVSRNCTGKSALSGIALYPKAFCARSLASTFYDLGIQ
jgi:hypothetical protein